MDSAKRAGLGVKVQRAHIAKMAHASLFIDDNADPVTDSKRKTERIIGLKRVRSGRWRTRTPQNWFLRFYGTKLRRC